MPPLPMPLITVPQISHCCPLTLLPPHLAAPSPCCPPHLAAPAKALDHRAADAQRHVHRNDTVNEVNEGGQTQGLWLKGHERGKQLTYTCNGRNIIRNKVQSGTLVGEPRPALNYLRCSWTGPRDSPTSPLVKARAPRACQPEWRTAGRERVGVQGGELTARTSRPPITHNKAKIPRRRSCAIVIT